MLLSTLSFLVLLGVPSGLGGQIPIIGGLLGGVPNASEMAELRAARQSRLSTAAPANLTPGKLRVVENSGICETTPNVYQASGYGDIHTNGSIWFWFFAARKNPDTAPLALWFNGGPGSSSMIGLIQEHGPCRITNDSSAVVLNPYSWNNEANVLYIDQPIGTGFSHGTPAVNTSQQAATDIWSFMQIFFADSRFSKYQANDLAIWTESYGGHYGPAFAAHFLSQNAAITSGTVSGVNLNLKVLGIGNGLTDPLTQYQGYIDYAASNPYHPLAAPQLVQAANTSWLSTGGCKDQISQCYSGSNDTICSGAQDYCNRFLLENLAGNVDVYYVPISNPDPYPPAFGAYLNSVRSQIGADIEWTESSDEVYINFALSGDWMRNSRPDLETVINAGVRTIIYDGDADFIVNYKGVEAMVDNLNTQFTTAYKQQTFQPYKVDGQTTGEYKSAGNFSYIRVYGAGHEVPAYKFGTLDYGQAAAQMFTQTMAGQPLGLKSAAAAARLGQWSTSRWIGVLSCFAWILC